MRPGDRPVPGTPLDAISFTGNTFSHLTDTDGMPAMNLNTVTGTVSGNTFQDIHQYGILLAGVLSNLSITGNLFDSIHNDTVSTSQNRGSGIRTFQQPTFGGPVSITGNTFSNDYHGVRVANDGPPANLPARRLLGEPQRVHHRRFRRDLARPGHDGHDQRHVQLVGRGVGPVECRTGSGTGITAGATFNPWLITSNLNGACVAAPTITEVFDGSNSSAAPTALGVAFTPGPDGGNPFTSFTATCSSLNGGPTATASGPGSPIFVGGLAATGAYQCTVTAANSSGSSAPSAPFTVFLGGPGNCLTVPTAPTALSRGPGNNSATVSWAPSSGCVAGYVVTTYVNGVAQVGASKLIPGHGTTTVMKGLTNGVAYQFTVAAENGSVVGPASSLTAPDHGGRARGSHRDARGAGREGIGQAHVHDPVGQWRADHELHRELRVDQPGRDEVEDRQSEPAHRVGAHRRQGVHVHGQGDEQPGNRTFFAEHRRPSRREHRAWRHLTSCAMPDYTAWGPLAHLIGTWEGDEGLDVAFAHATGSVGETPYRERTVMNPFGPVDNGTQALYGLDYRMSAWRGDRDRSVPHRSRLLVVGRRRPRGDALLHDPARLHACSPAAPPRPTRRASRWPPTSAPRSTGSCRTRISPAPRARPATCATSRSPAPTNGRTTRPRPSTTSGTATSSSTPTATASTG